MIENPPLRRAVRLVAVLNLGYFGIEIAVALAIGSVSLLADSVDFLEDAAVNLLIFAALRWTERNRALLGFGLAATLLAPAAAFLWMLWRKFADPVAPAAVPLGLTGLGALAVNLSCALILARFRRGGGSLTRAAFLSARNDALANVAIIAAGVATAVRPTIWPDVLVGLGVAMLNVDAAREVVGAAREEHRQAGP